MSMFCCQNWSDQLVNSWCRSRYPENAWLEIWEILKANSTPWTCCVPQTITEPLVAVGQECTLVGGTYKGESEWQDMSFHSKTSRCTCRLVFFPKWILVPFFSHFPGKRCIRAVAFTWCERKPDPFLPSCEYSKNMASGHVWQHGLGFWHLSSQH